MRPAAEGTRTMRVPMATARIFLKKVRRSSEGGGIVGASVMGRGFYGGARGRYKWDGVTLEVLCIGRVRSMTSLAAKMFARIVCSRIAEP